MSTVELTRLVMGLKLRLLTSGPSLQAALRVLGYAAALLAGVGGAAAVVLRADRANASDELMFWLAILSIGWLVTPLLMGGGETTLTVDRFSLFPITVRQLNVAMVGASTIGAPVIGTAIVLAAIASRGTGVVSAAILALCALVSLTTVVVGSRLGIALMSAGLRGRKARDGAALIVAVIAMLAGLAFQLGFFIVEWLTPSRLETGRSILRWLPVGWTPEAAGRASDGQVVSAVLFLGAGVVWLGLVFELWRRATAQLFTGAATAAAVVIERRSRIEGVIAAIAPPAVEASWMRSLRQIRRDPRELAQLAGFMPLVVIMALPSADLIREGDPRIVLASSMLGLIVAFTSMNMFGMDGPSFAVDALASADLTPVVLGKALARATIGIVPVVLGAIGLAAYTGGWSFVVPSILIAVSALLAALAVSVYVTVRYPFVVPEKTMSIGMQGNQGCLPGLMSLIGLLVALVISAPGVAATTAASIFVSALLGVVVGVVSVAYTLWIFVYVVRTSGRWASLHVPEMVEALSFRS